MITFVPLEEIEKMESWEGSQLNQAKERLAFELTKLVHSEEEAQKALDAARALFTEGANNENMPSSQITHEDFIDGKIDILSLLVAAGLTSSKGEGRRLVQQGGISVNGNKITEIDKSFTAEDFSQDFVIKKGKKVFQRVIL